MSAWVDLLGCQTRQIVGRYKTRIVEMGEGVPLFLLHGTGGHIENYVRNIAPLAEHFHVVALDFLWHGLSQTDGFNPEIIPKLVDQIVDVMDVLEISSAAIEGQSLGGWVAMRFALQHPARVDQLILTTTQGYVPDEGAVPGYEEPDWAQNIGSSIEVLRNPTFDNVRTRMARILADPKNLTDEAILIRRALYSRPDLAEVQQRFVREYLGGGVCRRHVVTDDLAREIKAPALVYWGDKNRTPPALGQHIAATIPNGAFHCAPSTGHWAQFESADEHNEVVTTFLLERREARRRKPAAW